MRYPSLFVCVVKTQTRAVIVVVLFALELIFGPYVFGYRFEILANVVKRLL